jgi:hypothetical protein
MDRDEVIEKIKNELEHGSNENLAWAYNQIFSKPIRYDVETEEFVGEN